MSGSVFGDGLTLAQASKLLGPGYPPASFQIMFGGPVQGNGIIPAADLVYLYKFQVFAPIVVTSIYQRCQVVGVGSALKCAVWRNDPAVARPTGLPVLGQNAGFDTSGSTGLKSAAVASVTLEAGTWWAGTKYTGASPQMVNITSASAVGIPAPSQAGTTAGAVAMLVGFSAPDAYANDIMALDLTAATFTAVQTNGTPVIGLGWV